MIRVVVAAWIFKDDKVLLVLHRKLGRWLPPGGHVERDEHVLDALRREIREGVGLRVRVVGLPPLVDDTGVIEELPLPFRVSSYSRQGGDELTLDFVAVTDDDRVLLQEEELQDYQWFSLEELRNARFVSDRVKRFGERAFAYLGEVSR